MTAQADPYVRVYYSITDDDKFAEVYEDDAALATWLRLLINADAMFPAAAHIPAGTDPAVLGRLIDLEIVDRVGTTRYRIHGLESERSRRSETARGMAAKRWAKPGNADADAAAMPTHMPTHSAGMMPSDALRSSPLRSDPIHSAPLPERARYGLPHITDEVGREIETITGRSITTLTGLWAGELDRLIEERGDRTVVTAVGDICRTMSHPSWPQIVAGVRNTLEPLPGAVKAMTPEEARKAEKEEALRLLRSKK